MAVAVSYPGVYIEEFTPGAPIQGVGTSTAAFLGPACAGRLMEPVQLTSWDAFKAEFGDQPLPGYYLWYAVRGYFENGGQVCWVVRVSNASAARWVLNDANGVPTLVVTARTPGTVANGVRLRLRHSHAITAAVFRHQATIQAVSGIQLTFASGDDAVRFRPGDLVTVSEAQLARVRILSVNGANISLTEPLAAAQHARHLQLANVRHDQGDTVIRLQISGGNPVDLAPGSLLQVTQGATTAWATVTSVSTETVTLADNTTVTTYRTTVADPLPDLDLGPAAPAVTVQSSEFDLTVRPPTGTATTYPNLSMSPSSRNYYGQQVNLKSELVTVSPAAPPSTSIPPENIPAELTALTGPQPTGQAENLGSLGPYDYQAALDLIRQIRGINQVAIPDRTDTTVQGMLRVHCEGAPPRIGERFAILDAQRGVAPSGPGSVTDQRSALDSVNGYAALYYPWILVPPAPPAAGSPPPASPPDPILVPPSGHVAGIYARIDNSRGVHKAPAGEEAGIAGALGVERQLGDIDQGLLNLSLGINVIRVFRPNGQPTVWGARTTATGVNSSWQYVNIRRLFLYLEGSITASIRWAVFEPNNLELWGKLKRTISAFLNRVWRDGALFGATAKDAYYVRIDNALNPPSDLALGRLTIEVGVRPAYPAEFIVVRIGIWEGGSEITEQ
jgi:phage tail sheath protein FI